MAYPSKIARECDRAERAFIAWTRSLDTRSLEALRADLAAVQARLESTPARHQRKLVDRAARVRVLTAAIAAREVR